MNFNQPPHQPHPLWPQVQDPPLPPHINAQNAALYLPHRFGAINGMDPPALHFSRFPYSAALNLVPNAPIHLFQAVQPGNLPQNLQQNMLQITQRFPLPLTLTMSVANDRLKSYGYMDGPQGPRCTTRPLPFPGSLPVIPLPSREQQINAIHGLWAWHQERCTRPNRIEVESEPAVQDEVKRQLLIPLELLLYNGGWLSYPRWGRTTIESNLGREEHGKRTAGFSDHVLYIGGHKQCTATIFEIKTFWSYSSTRMNSISGPSNGALDPVYDEKVFIPVAGDTNVIDWASGAVWGQMVFNDTVYAIWTNGRHILVFVRTGINELTVSTHDYDTAATRRSHRWDDPDVLTALFGLCCAAIDSKILGNQDLMQYLVGQRH
ncbi:hypothetical protein EV359DRAFT_62934 [Lentinula novae-zelandiae]|nr:hypothetical protein EV359DRAFT_62934 [Lentinula novae-zelandiae]